MHRFAFTLLRPAIISLAIATLAILSLSSLSRAQVVQDNLWVTDGYVESVVASGNVIYLGGGFDWVGPSTGHFVGIDENTGAVVRPFPSVAGGVVRALAPDGSGGFFVGGTFTAVRGEPRSGLAHLDANGNLTSWNPTMDGEVWALARSGETVFVAGIFQNAGNKSRNGIAALDATTGLATDWDAHADGYWVSAIAVNGNNIYVSGNFNNIGGQARKGLAALDVGDGTATAWDPNANGIGPTNADVLVVSGGTVYVGGGFTDIGSEPRNYLAAIDVVTGALSDWNPNPNQGISTLVSEGTIYAGGPFTEIGGQPRNYIAALDSLSGQATSWNPDITSLTASPVYAIMAKQDTIYVGGYFFGIGGQSYNCLAALDATTALALPWNPHADPSSGVLCLGRSAGRIFAGGEFETMGGRTRNNIAALDGTTGEATNWDPNADGVVRTIAVNGDKVYAGGDFSGIGGESRYGIAQLDASTGLATTWDAQLDGYVEHISPGGSSVYVSGPFNNIGGQPRNYLAALDAADGSATNWDADMNAIGTPTALLASGDRVYVSGNFSEIGGQPRYYLAALDTLTGADTNWDPAPSDPVNAIAVSGSAVYVGGSFGAVGGAERSHLAALDAATGMATSWDPNVYVYGSVDCIAVSGDSVYVGGLFPSVGGWAYNNLAAVDATTGQVIYWYPNPNNEVRSIALIGSRVYAGGYFDVAMGSPRLSLAGFFQPQTIGLEPPVGVLPMALRAAPNPFRSGVAVTFSLPQNEDVSIKVYDLAGSVVRRLHEGALPAGEQHVTWDGRNDSGNSVSTGLYVVRVQAGALELSRKVFRIR